MAGQLKDREKIPTYCAGCSFKCVVSDCDCKCHDKMRKYYNKHKGAFKWQSS